MIFLKQLWNYDLFLLQVIFLNSITLNKDI